MAWANNNLNTVNNLNTGAGVDVPTVRCDSLDPQIGPEGGTISLHGDGFLGLSTRVTISGQTATNLLVTDTRIDAVVPNGAVSGQSEGSE